MNRRHFLKVISTAAAISMVPVTLAAALAEKLPVIYGDGVHDDTKALQAAMDGKPFACPNGSVMEVDGHLYCNGRYLISDTIHMRGNVYIANLIFVSPHRSMFAEYDHLVHISCRNGELDIRDLGAVPE